MYQLLELRQLPIKTVIDVGANTGQFARNTIDVFPDARLYCFEPQPEPFRQLEQWARSVPAGRVQALNLALGDTDGQVEMHVFPRLDVASSLLAPTPQLKNWLGAVRDETRILVPLRRLDTIPSIELEPDVLVKLDAQGYDGQIIRGGRETLRQSRACLVEVELDPMYEGQSSFLEIDNLLAEVGLTYRGNVGQAHAPDGHAIYVEALFTRQG